MKPVLVLVSLLALAGCVYGPAPVVYAPPPPRPHLVWHPGHWFWNGTGWVWVHGHYVRVARAATADAAG